VSSCASVPQAASCWQGLVAGPGVFATCCNLLHSACVELCVSPLDMPLLLSAPLLHVYFAATEL
jgi:hypothetical protein